MHIIYTRVFILIRLSMYTSVCARERPRVYIDTHTHIYIYYVLFDKKKNPIIIIKKKNVLMSSDRL